MSSLLEKRHSKRHVAGISGAIVYLVAILAVPITHTCSLSQACLSPCCFGGSERHCSGQTGVYGGTEASSKQNVHEGGALPYDSACTACVYSLCCKTTQVHCGTASIALKIPCFGEASPITNAVMRLEWSSSISSRAPPFTTS